MPQAEGMASREGLRALRMLSQDPKDRIVEGPSSPLWTTRSAHSLRGLPGARPRLRLRGRLPAWPMAPLRGRHLLLLKQAQS